MKVALVTTPPSVRSGIGDYTRHLVPFLREHCDVQLFVEHGQDEAAWGDERARSVADLHPKDFDQILYQLGNEQAHAFMPRMLRALGGTVMQHDWVLFDLALKAFPALVRGGARGHALALREGGLAQVHTYLRNWLDRRRERSMPNARLATGGLPGALLYGWHAPEPGARWMADFGGLRLPAEGVHKVRLEFHLDPRRVLRVIQDGRVLAESHGGIIEFEPASGDHPEFLLEVEGVRVTRAQRQHGDARRLGVAFTRIAWHDASGERMIDLGGPAAVPLAPVNLTRDRFDLPLNRSVVRFGDAFLCHSRYVADRILRERNVPTPIGLVHHGSFDRWRAGNRRDTRRSLGLGPEWVDSCLIVSFGGVQPHKRIDKVLEALARARRERPELRLILAGSMHSGEFDPVRLADHLGVSEAVKFTGYITEVAAWDWLHAADMAINLRGPTTGGTSGGIFQAFSMGRAVIVSEAAEQKELPSECVVPVPLGEGEVPTLARELVALCDDGARRARLESSVRKFVTEECHWRVVAQRYAQHLASFPRPRASRRKLIALRVGLQRSAL